jgi:hypothetical protein
VPGPGRLEPAELGAVLPRLAAALRPGGVLAAVALPREAAAELAGAAGYRVLGAAFAVLRASGRGGYWRYLLVWQRPAPASGPAVS